MDFPHSVVFLALFVIAAAGNNSANDTVYIEVPSDVRNSKGMADRQAIASKLKLSELENSLNPVTNQGLTDSDRTLVIALLAVMSAVNVILIVFVVITCRKNTAERNKGKGTDRIIHTSPRPFEQREDIRLSETRLNKRYNRNSQSSSYESPLRQLSIAEENEEVSEPVHSQGISHQGQTNQGFQHTPRTSIQRNGSLVRPDHSNVQPLHRAYSVQPRVHYDQTALHRETPANRMLDRSLSIEHSVPPLEHSTPKLHRTHSYQPDRVLSARSARQLKELRGEYDTSL